MTEAQAAVIRSAIANRLNIVIAGGTGSGKTTSANAVIAEIIASAPDDRMVILEDTATGAADNACACIPVTYDRGAAAQEHHAPPS